MFTPFGETYAVSNGALVTVADNTDLSIDGTSKLVVFGDRSTSTPAKDEFVDLDFGSINISARDEIVMHLFTGEDIEKKALFRVTIDGKDFDFGPATTVPMQIFKFNAIGITALTQIKITCLVDFLEIFIDAVGHRQTTTEDQDDDLIQAFEDEIVITPGISSVLGAAGATGKTVDIATKDYFEDGSRIRLTEGGTTEDAEIESEDQGTLRNALVNTFTDAATATLLASSRHDREDMLANDPMVGILFLGESSDIKIDRTDKISDGTRKKRRWTGERNLMVYLESSSEKIHRRMVSEYRFTYGDEFQIFLDGQLVNVYSLGVPASSGKDAGGLMRTTWTYLVRPHPITIATADKDTTPTLTIESKEVTAI